jgi:aspartate 1-decarboxylase
MLIEILKSKIQEAVITETKLFYEGSIGIDGRVMEKVGLIPGEKVHVLNYNNGERFETYIIEEKANSGAIILYGPAARKGRVGDKVCILSYGFVEEKDAKKIKPKTICLNSKNRIKK